MRRCVAVFVAVGSWTSAALAADPGKVFASYSSLQADNYNVARVGSNLGSSETIFDDNASIDPSRGYYRYSGVKIDGLAASDTSIYFSRQGNIFQYSTEGAFVARLAGASTNSYGKLSFANGLLLASYSSLGGDNYNIAKIDSDLGQAVTIFDDNVSIDPSRGYYRFSGVKIDGLAASSTSIYFSRQGDIFQYSTDGTFVAKLAGTSTNPYRELSFANGSLFASYSSLGGDNYNIAKIDSDLSQAVTIFDDNASIDPSLGYYRYSGVKIDGLAATDSSIYFSRQGNIFQYTRDGEFVARLPGTNGEPFGTIAVSTISSAVPEPSLWVMLTIGFGLVGARLRDRSRSSGALSR